MGKNYRLLKDIHIYITVRSEILCNVFIGRGNNDVLYIQDDIAFVWSVLVMLI